MGAASAGSRVRLSDELPSLNNLKVYLSSHKNYKLLEQKNIYQYFSTRSKYVFCPKRHLGQVDWETINNMLLWCDILIISGDTAGAVEERSFKEITTVLSLNKPVFRVAIEPDRSKTLKPRLVESVTDIKLVEKRHRKEHFYGRIVLATKDEVDQGTEK